MTQTLAERLLSRLASMQAERALVEPFYQAASYYFDPLMARYWVRTGTEKRGPNWNGDLFSGAGIAALDRLTNFLQGNGTPASAPWLQLQDGELEGNAEADQFWADSTRWMEKDLRGNATYAGSFYISKRMEYRQMAISYGVTAIYEKQINGVMTGDVVYEAVPSHSFFYQLDAFGRMRAGAYVRSMTDEQVKDLVGRNRVNAETGDMAAAKSSDRHDIVQMVMMNDTPRDIPRSPDEFPFVCYWIDRQEKKVLLREGFYSQYFHVMGWNQIPASNYFVGPCYNALPDMVSAAAARKSQIMAMEWAGTPPLLGADKIAGAEKTLRPRRITWGAMGSGGKEMIKPLQSGANPGALFQQVQDDESRVRTMLFGDELLSQRRPNMTATEAQIVANERAAMVAPFMVTTIPCIRSQVARHFDIALRAGRITDVPEAVSREGVFDADVIGPLAIAAKQAGVGSILNTVEMVAMVEQSGAQRVDVDEAVTMIAAANGTSALLRDMAEVREEMQQAAAVQQEAVAAEIENTESASLKNVMDAAGAMEAA